MSSSSPCLSAIVSSIIKSFASAREILNRIKPKKRTTKLHKKNEVNAGGGASKLRNSLLTRPRDLRREYESQSTKLGRRFSDGDGANSFDVMGAIGG